MTAKKSSTKRRFKITLMRSVFQAATLEVDAPTREEALKLAEERESSLTPEDWKGPFERAVYDEDGRSESFRII